MFSNIVRQRNHIMSLLFVIFTMVWLDAFALCFSLSLLFVFWCLLVKLYLCVISYRLGNACWEYERLTCISHSADLAEIAKFLGITTTVDTEVIQVSLLFPASVTHKFWNFIQLTYIYSQDVNLSFNFFLLFSGHLDYMLWTVEDYFTCLSLSAIMLNVSSMCIHLWRELTHANVVWIYNWFDPAQPLFLELCS